MSAQPQFEPDEIEWEIADLIAEYGSERAALRAYLTQRASMLADADRCVSRGFVKGWFSDGARAPQDDERGRSDGPEIEAVAFTRQGRRDGARDQSVRMESANVVC